MKKVIALFRKELMLSVSLLAAIVALILRRGSTMTTRVTSSFWWRCS